MHDAAAAGKNKIVRAPRARRMRGRPTVIMHDMQVAGSYSCNYSCIVARLVHNDASHDGRCERRLTVAHSILAGAVVPHQDAQEAF
jgi:hypothetical protein